MTKFQLTARLKGIITESAWSSERKTKLLEKDWIDHETLIQFYRECHPTASMLDLLKATRLVPFDSDQEKVIRRKTEEFLKSMEHLRLREKEEEYQKLVKPNSAMNTLYAPKFDDEQVDTVRQHKETKNHITTMFNIFVSVASVVYAIWYWTDSSWGIRDSYRILICLFFGILILVAEVVVYLGYLRRVEEAKVKERNKKEVKKVIRSFTIN